MKRGADKGTADVAQALADLIAAANIPTYDYACPADAEAEGFYSIADAAKACNAANETARNFLQKAYDEGKVERVRVKKDSNTAYYYRAVK